MLNGVSFVMRGERWCCLSFVFILCWVESVLAGGNPADQLERRANGETACCPSEVLKEVEAQSATPLEPIIPAATKSSIKTNGKSGRSFDHSDVAQEIPSVEKLDAVTTDPSVAETKDQAQEFLSFGVELMEETREIVSRKVKKAAIELDNFISGQEVDDVVNGTYIKLGFSETLEKAGRTYVKQKVKLKLDLPNTEKRLKIIFESDPEDNDSLEERNRELVSESVRLTDDGSTSGALRAMLAGNDKWRVSIDAGLRSTPIDPFARCRIKRKDQFGDQLNTRIQQSLYYFDEDGWIESSELYIQYQLTERVYLVNKMEAQFQDQDNTFEFAQVASILQIVSDRHSLSYSMGVIGENRPVPRATSYFFNMAYRYRLMRKWIFLNVIPDFSFPREEDFTLQPSLTIRLDFILSQDEEN